MDTHTYHDRRGDGHYVPAYGTSNGEWKTGVDYVIEHKAVFELYFDDKAFRQVIDTGRFVFVENHLCLADRRYVTMGKTQNVNEKTARMTDYARNHIDKCCLAFRERGSASHKYYDGFLNKEICEYVKDYKFDALKSPEENAQTMVEYAEITQHLPNGFGETMKYHMKRVRTTTEKLADALEISDRLVYDYLRAIPPANLTLRHSDSPGKGNSNPKRPTKKTVVSMALLIHLMPDWSTHLLNQASYELDMTQHEELAWLCALKTSYM